MNRISDQPEFRRLLAQCCDGTGISADDFDTLIELSRDCAPEDTREVSALLDLMRLEAFP